VFAAIPEVITFAIIAVWLAPSWPFTKEPPSALDPSYRKPVKAALEVLEGRNPPRTSDVEKQQ
jgi:hypothetical protein